MLGNEVALWETLLAAIKLGVVVTPATTLLTTAIFRTASTADAFGMSSRARPTYRSSTA